MNIKNIKQFLKEPSTMRGIALLGASVATATGNGELFNANISDSGIELGGFLVALVTFVTGLFDFTPDKYKLNKAVN